jgi:hypothetical protein
VVMADQGGAEGVDTLSGAERGGEDMEAGEGSE